MTLSYILVATGRFFFLTMSECNKNIFFRICHISRYINSNCYINYVVPRLFIVFKQQFLTQFLRNVDSAGIYILQVFIKKMSIRWVV